MISILKNLVTPRAQNVNKYFSKKIKKNYKKDEINFLI